MEQGVRIWVHVHMQIAGLLCLQEMSEEGVTEGLMLV